MPDDRDTRPAASQKANSTQSPVRDSARAKSGITSIVITRTDELSMQEVMRNVNATGEAFTVPNAKDIGDVAEIVGGDTRLPTVAGSSDFRVSFIRGEAASEPDEDGAIDAESESACGKKGWGIVNIRVVKCDFRFVEIPTVEISAKQAKKIARRHRSDVGAVV